MRPTPEQVDVLVECCERFRESKAPGGYPGGLALCVIDSVQSTGVKYSSVVNVVNAYRKYRRAQGSDPDTDGAKDLLQTFDELGGPLEWAKAIGNQNKTSTRAGAPLKASAIRDAAAVLVDQRIYTTADLRAAAQDPTLLERAETSWLGVAGQRSGITWHYVLMLAGVPGIKPDRMITRFVADSLHLPRRSVTPGFALAALKETAKEMEISPSDLDHGIWQWQRQRR